MNRRSLVLSASALGAAAFAGGSWLVRDRQAREAAAEADDEQDDNKEEQKPEKRFPDAERCGEQSDERP